MRRNCNEETLTAMVNSGHSRPSMQARRRTQLPRSMINPLCSAIAMNSLGGISAAGRMLPAAERFHAHHGIAALVD